MNELEYLFQNIRRYLLIGRTEVAAERDRVLAEADRDLDEIERLMKQNHKIEE